MAALKPSLAPRDIEATLAWLRQHPALKQSLARPLGRVETSFAALDVALGGGLPTGAISELVGPESRALPSSGRTSLALTTLSAATRCGHVVAWVDADDTLDPLSLRAAGAELARFLWVRPHGREARKQALQAADLVVAAGGFAAVVLDLVGARASSVPPASWVRLSHRLAGTGTALVVLTAHTLVGAQAHLRLTCRLARGATLEVRVDKQRGREPGARVALALGPPVD